MVGHIQCSDNVNVPLFVCTLNHHSNQQGVSEKMFLLGRVPLKKKSGIFQVWSDPTTHPQKRKKFEKIEIFIILKWQFGK